MGLDVYHLKASDKKSAARIVVPDDRLERFSHLSKHIRDEKIHVTDWVETFKNYGLDNSDFEQVLSGHDRNSSRYIDYIFVKRSDPKTRVLFTERPKMFAFLRDRFGTPFMGPQPMKGHKVCRGEYEQKEEKETAIYAEVVGKMRNGTLNAFFDAYRPVDLDTGPEAAERMLPFVLPRNTEDFRKAFVEAWDPDLSFIMVHW